MKTIKVIDLLNKIAKGEEVPKRIKYNDKNWNYKDGIMEYISDDTFFALSNFEFDELNDEVEIIEPQEHKIPEKLNIIQEKNCKNNWKWKVYGEEHGYNISTPQKIIADKINEMLDYLEEIK